MKSISEVLSKALSEIKVEETTVAESNIKNELEIVSELFVTTCPRRFRDYLTEEIDNSVLDVIDRGDAVTIAGAVGSRKTTTAFTIGYQWAIRRAKTCLRLVQKGHDIKIPRNLVRYSTAINYVFAIRNSFDKGGAEKIRNEAIDARLYIIDDLFATKTSDHVHEEIIHLLNERYQWKRPTIVTTNKTVEEISEIDDRIASRLSEGMVIDRSGESDFRMQNH